MMNSYRPNNDRRSRKKLLFATFAVVALFLIDLFSGGKIRTLVRSETSLVWRIGNGITERISGSGFFSSRASLVQQNAVLRDEITQVQEQAAAYSASEFENEQLRALVHLAGITPGMTAPVISSFRASPYGTFTIGAGASDGVATGAIVATGDGFVIGQVEDVSAHASLVRELFAPGQSVEASAHGTPVVLQGQGGGNATGDLPHGATVAAGDPVLAPALGQRPIGIVGQVEASAASASTKIYVRLPVNLESLSFVYVEKSP